MSPPERRPSSGPLGDTGRAARGLRGSLHSEPESAGTTPLPEPPVTTDDATTLDQELERSFFNTYACYDQSSNHAPPTPARRKAASEPPDEHEAGGRRRSERSSRAEGAYKARIEEKRRAEAIDAEGYEITEEVIEGEIVSGRETPLNENAIRNAVDAVEVTKPSYMRQIILLAMVALAATGAFWFIIKSDGKTKDPSAINAPVPSAQHSSEAVANVQPAVTSVSTANALLVDSATEPVETTQKSADSAVKKKPVATATAPPGVGAAKKDVAPSEPVDVVVPPKVVQPEAGAASTAKPAEPGKGDTWQFAP